MFQRYKNYIKTQAEDFDKLRWNQKNKNFVLFISLCSIIICMFFFLVDTFSEEITPENKWHYMKNAILLVIMIPAQYLAYKDYISGMIALLLVSAATQSYIFSILMIMPIQIEIYRRKHKKMEAKNLKRDIVISFGLSFIILLITGLKLL